MADDGLGTGYIDDVRLFQHWPVGRTTQKVPSEYSYSLSPRGQKQWGHDIDNDSLVLKWTKMDLEPKGPQKELKILGDLVKGLDKIRELDSRSEGVGIPQHLTRNESDVVRDYLTKVVREWYIWFCNNVPNGREQFDSIPLDVVITHPAEWSYIAMNKTYRAVVAAFSRDRFPKFRDVYLISEPEACALYTVQDLLRQDFLKGFAPGDGFVLCDGGGGTVDVVSYEVRSIEPLVMNKLGEVTGSRCGATFIDRGFLQWIVPKVENLRISPSDIGTGGHFVITRDGRALLNRWEPIKLAYTGEGEVRLQLFGDSIVRPGYEEKIVDGVATLTKNDMKEIFGKSVGGTVDLVRRQIAQAHNLDFGKKPVDITHVFLAGGFAQNDYLLNEVRRSTDQMGNIDCRRATDCWSGVVKGAVLAGAGVGMAIPPVSRSCPRHYGFCVSKTYAHWKDNIEGPSKSKYSGEIMSDNQLEWVVSKGDLILPTRPLIQSMEIKLKFSKNLKPDDKMRITFVSTAMEDAPTHTSKLSNGDEVKVIEWEMSRWPTKQLKSAKGQSTFSSHWTADIIAKVQIQDRVVVELKCGGKVLQSYLTNL